MEKEFNEYITFNVTAKDGSNVEMAVVDEFDYNRIANAYIHMEE